MTRQYKAMQEELLGKINELQNTINSLKDELGTWLRWCLAWVWAQTCFNGFLRCFPPLAPADTRVEMEATKREHDRQLKEKDDVNEALKLKVVGSCLRAGGLRESFPLLTPSSSRLRP